MSRGTAVTVSAIIKLIEADGWALSRRRCSHRHFKHPTRPDVVTVVVVEVVA